MTAASHPPSTLPHVVGVQFKPAGLIHEYDNAGLDLTRGDPGIVESPHATELATVARPPAPIAAPSDTRPARVLRKANANDFDRDEQNRVRAHEAHRLCLTRIRERRAEDGVEVEVTLEDLVEKRAD